MIDEEVHQPEQPGQWSLYQWALRRLYIICESAKDDRDGHHLRHQGTHCGAISGIISNANSYGYQIRSKLAVVESWDLVWVDKC